MLVKFYIIIQYYVVCLFESVERVCVCVAPVPTRLSLRHNPVSACLVSCACIGGKGGGVRNIPPPPLVMLGISGVWGAATPLLFPLAGVSVNAPGDFTWKKDNFFECGV